MKVEPIVFKAPLPEPRSAPWRILKRRTLALHHLGNDFLSMFRKELDRIHGFAIVSHCSGTDVIEDSHPGACRIESQSFWNAFV